MTSETPNLHVSKNLNISKTKQDIEKLKTLLRLVWKCCSDAFDTGSTIFRHMGTLISQKLYLQTVFSQIDRLSFFISRSTSNVFCYWEWCWWNNMGDVVLPHRNTICACYVRYHDWFSNGYTYGLCHFFEKGNRIWKALSEWGWLWWWLTIRLRARDFCEVIVDEGDARSAVIS